MFVLTKYCSFLNFPFAPEERSSYPGMLKTQPSKITLPSILCTVPYHETPSNFSPSCRVTCLDPNRSKSPRRRFIVISLDIEKYAQGNSGCHKFLQQHLTSSLTTKKNNEGAVTLLPRLL
ncbi:hypothetical protein ONS95_002559 [Cadophora gregata]|uniref:uncharacterized protein n=1 Tax=Cadophora gregata TaxID=51156 RepID=UPI0026DB2AFC|nr:uncharacterized protein ONS95_002559 [Cadophora gregata]KAK0109888.1 hypothetical protein ONS95_002559 [Cadophora gregata]KAK0110485.1 hypothetical protein ONS96_002094 [Cadophora gregata f. sp. sojae]